MVEWNEWIIYETKVQIDNDLGKLTKSNGEYAYSFRPSHATKYFWARTAHRLVRILPRLRRIENNLIYLQWSQLSINCPFAKRGVSA